MTLGKSYNISASVKMEITIENTKLIHMKCLEQCQTQNTTYISICYYYKGHFSTGISLQDVLGVLPIRLNIKIKHFTFNKISKYIIFNYTMESIIPKYFKRGVHQMLMMSLHPSFRGSTDSANLPPLTSAPTASSKN